MLLKPNPENKCFGCGGANPRGMHLTFEQDDATNRIRGAFRLGREYQGGANFIHGGIIATVLDEVMGKVCRFRNARAVTAELTIEYLKPVPIDADLEIEGHEIEMNGRNIHIAGEIRNQDRPSAGPRSRTFRRPPPAARGKRQQPKDEIAVEF